jgi:hypothetical protein
MKGVLNMYQSVQERIKALSILELLKLISKGKAQNAVTDVKLAFGGFKLDQSEEAFDCFVKTVRKCLRKNTKRVCKLVQFIIEELKNGNTLSIFKYNRFTKAIVKEVIDHVIADCPNRCGVHKDGIYMLAVKKGIYNFYPSNKRRKITVRIRKVTV